MESAETAWAGAEGGKEEPVPRVHVPCSVWDSSGFETTWMVSTLEEAIDYLKLTRIKRNSKKSTNSSKSPQAYCTWSELPNCRRQEARTYLNDCEKECFFYVL